MQMKSKSYVVIYVWKLRQNHVTKIALELRQEVTLDLRQKIT